MHDVVARSAAVDLTDSSSRLFTVTLITGEKPMGSSTTRQERPSARDQRLRAGAPLLYSVFSNREAGGQSE